MKKVISLSEIKKIPFEINFNGNEYIISKDSFDKYILLTNICPHLGATIKVNDDCLECPAHFWKFNFEGKPINIKGDGLSFVYLTDINGELFVEDNLVIDNLFVSRKLHKSNHSIDIKLHSHACVEILYKNFSILSDPWIVGTSFLNSWINYPKSVVDPNKLNPDLIYISHEHSDHLHEESLNFFDLETLICFPDFPNKRIELILRRNGFNNLLPLNFGKEYLIFENVRLVCYEPQSLWNDSILYVDVDGFKILNTNDAGINQKIKKLVGDIDLLMTGFSTTASGYPATWDHISIDDKKLFYKRAIEGTYNMLESSVKAYNAKYLLPFAAFTTLLQSKHQKFVEISDSTNVDEIKERFSNSNFETINLLPGESWNTGSNKFERIYTSKQRDKLHSKGNKLSYALNWNANNKVEHILKEYATKAQVIEYFLKFNHVPEIIFCENLKFKISVLDKFEGDYLFDFTCDFFEGKLEVINNSELVDVEMWIPIDILTKIVTENLSWDEAHIGYWCRFTRHPDVFHQNFWRLLQTPYYVKQDARKYKNKTRKITLKSNLASVLNSNPLYELVFQRYGMYCYTCGKSFAEDIESGVKSHGLSQLEINRLLDELNFIDS